MLYFRFAENTQLTKTQREFSGERYLQPKKKSAMGRISISETQFAFAFFHKYLLLKKNPALTFFFPSLQQEGNPKHFAAGADLVVNKILFFQFKMADFLRTRGAAEIINRKIPKTFVPFYRFHIKNSNPSNQFDLLKNAAKNPSNIVRYISPMFHADKYENDDDAFANFFSSPPTDLNRFICSVNFDQFVRHPETNLSKDNSHKICYNLATLGTRRGYLFSEPKEIVVHKGVEELQNNVLLFSRDRTTAINDNLSFVKENFFAGDDILFRTDSIYEIQTALIIRHNIFWIPVLESRSEQIDQTLSKLIQ